MADVTKHPHYVYRAYLRSWTRNEQIYCLRNRNKLFPANIMKVGQEKEFYNFPICTDEEIEIGYLFAEGGLIKIMKIYECINNELKKEMKNTLSDKASEMFEFSKQFEETYFNGIVENRLNPMLQALYKKDFSFLDDEVLLMHFYHAIAEQYCRTKKIRESVNVSMAELDNPNIRGDNVWFLIRHSIAFKIGLALFSGKYDVNILENADGLFITSDQPVINIHADNGKSIPTEFELFYPISPNLALLITNQINLGNRETILINNDEAMLINERLAEQSYNQLYSDKKYILQKYMLS